MPRRSATQKSPNSGADSKFYSPANSMSTQAADEQEREEETSGNRQEETAVNASRHKHHQRQQPSEEATRRASFFESTRSSRISEIGREISEIPTSSVSGTTFNIVACIIGAGILSLPVSLYHASMVPGCLLVLFFFFMSVFVGFVLSISSEFTGTYSQSSLLTLALLGRITSEDLFLVELEEEGNGGTQSQEDVVDDDDDEKSSLSANVKIQYQTKHQWVDDEEETTRLTPAPAPIVSPERTKLISGDEEENDDDNNHQDRRGPVKNEKEKTTPQKNKKKKENESQQQQQREEEEGGEEDDEAIALKAAVQDALHCRQQVVAFVDIIYFIQMFLYIVIFSTVSADSAVSVSKDLNFSGITQSKVFWLIIIGSIFLLCSLRRTFSEVSLTSALGVLSVMLCAVFMVIRFAQSPTEYASSYEHDLTGHYFSPSIQLLFSVATMSSAFSYQLIHPMLHLELKAKSVARMQRSVVAGVSLVASSFLAVGVCGLLMFGNNVVSKTAAGNIINNFSQHDVLINVGRVALVLHFISIFPVTAVTVRTLFHRTFILRLRGFHKEADDPEAPLKVSMVTVVVETAGLVSSGVFLASVFGNLSTLLGLAGSIGSTLSMCTVPAIVGIRVFGELDERDSAAKEAAANADLHGAALYALPETLTDKFICNIDGSLLCHYLPSWISCRRCCYFLLVLAVVLHVGGLIITLSHMTVE